MANRDPGTSPLQFRNAFLDGGWSWKHPDGLKVIGNSIAGADGPCMSSKAGWHMRHANFKNNTGHGCALGFAVKGSVVSRPDKDFGVIQDLTFYRISKIAVWGYSTSNAPVISNVRVADAAVGFFWGGVGPDAEAHQVPADNHDHGFSLRRSLYQQPVQYAIGVLCPSLHRVLNQPSVCGPLGRHWTKSIYGMEHQLGPILPLLARYAPIQPSCASSTIAGRQVFHTTIQGSMDSSDAVPSLLQADYNRC